MKMALIPLPLLLVLAGPAHATGGMTCKTSGPRPVEISLVIGHTAGSPVVSARMVEARHQIEVRAAQWWLDTSELRLLLIDPQASRAESMVKARKNGRFYDGSMWRKGQRRWVRCQES